MTAALYNVRNDTKTIRKSGCLGGTRMKKQTFILEINDTKNQSWQGQVEWVQGQKKEAFRSVMELLHLVDSVVNEEEKPDFKK